MCPVSLKNAVLTRPEQRRTAAFVKIEKLKGYLW
jgi:hypothetical protein